MRIKASAGKLLALLFAGVRLRLLRSRHLFDYPGCCAA